MTDTSPLHYLVLIEHTAILPPRFERIPIPPAVAEELQHPYTPTPIRAWMSSPPAWLEVRTPRQTPEARLLRLGAGERDTILLAQEVQADLLLMDDLAGRGEAARRAFAVMGTLRLLELAAECKLLDLPVAMTRLQATSFYLPAPWFVTCWQATLPENSRRKQGPKTVYHYFQRWRLQALWEKVHTALREPENRLDLEDARAAPPLLSFPRDIQRRVVHASETRLNSPPEQYGAPHS